MTPPHNCLHEELIQDHSLQITKLDEKSKYKEQSIMEIKEDLKEVNKKLDKLISKSEKNDSKLEKRVETLETKIQVYEEFFKTIKDDNDKRTKNLIAICAIIATIIGIIISIIIKFL